MMQYLMHRNDPREGLRLTLDIDDFLTSTTVAVMPYDGMKLNDTVEVIFQTFVTADQPIGRITPMAKKLEANEDLDKPVVFSLKRSELVDPVNLVGFDAAFYFTVTPEEGPTRKSITQTVRLLLADPTAERLATPRFEGEVGTVLYPDEHPDGVALTAPAYTDIKANDSVVLFDSTGGVADWQFVTDTKGLNFTVSQDWLDKHVGEPRLTLQMHYGRANQGLRSLPLPLRVENKRTFEDAPVLPSTLTFYTARAGLDASIPARADIEGGSTIMHIVTGDNEPLLHTSVYRELNGEKVFRFAPDTLDITLGLETKVFFVHTTPNGNTLKSKDASLQISLPGISDHKYFPRLQCLQAQGIDKLRLPLMTDLDLTLGGWPLMAAGQRVKIVIVRDDYSVVVVDEKIKEPDVQAKLFTARVSRDHISGEDITFQTTLYFNVSRLPDGEGAALKDLKLSLR
ncbi:hypothetical protein [Pseudomonas sp. CCOS 191]|uniref:hypothetical protein n=1 Tax=Pseudomonas sp. CCOS 191 TaxID=1649877 RepID=UPI0018E66EEA|nr:hypothetical protein [Pseudomonas sp. CCOS 191]MBI6955952.1 hypothetical protein [Pseudomonas sp. CCOS 191]